MNKQLRIAGATVNQTPLDWSNNVRNIVDGIAEARKKNARIVCFPELSLTGYGCEDLFLSDWLSEKAWAHLQSVIPHCKEITACIGIPLRINHITYNGVCVISNEKILGITLKQNMARDGVHYEPRWFDPWPANKVSEVVIQNQPVLVGDLIYEVDGIKFGFEICEDAWRKDSRPGYRLRNRAVNLIMNPSASHFAMSKSTLREKEVVIDGSHKFNCAYLFVNLLGNEAGRMIYDGDIIFGQHGKLLKINDRLSFKRFNVLTCDIDFEKPELSEHTEITDNKEKNEELARATSLGLFDYMRKSRSNGFVLSLSGGADSSLCAVMVSEMVRRAVKELGWNEFTDRSGISSKPKNEKEALSHILACAYQGTKNSSEKTLQAAEKLAESIGATFHHWNIDNEVNSYISKIENAIQRPLTWETDDITLQNIQARSRSPIIWMLANIKKAVLLTTSNRSEGNVGYATMDGDTSGSLAPIAGLDKPFIIQWLKWAEKELGYKGLSYVNNLQPTAELRPAERAQTDEKDLMPYTLLVCIEKSAIRDRKSPLEVYTELQKTLSSTYTSQQLKEYIKKFFRLWSYNQWKRERLAPSFHLDDLNVDPRSWCRFPILSGNFAEELQQLDQA
jgi:NAD+ synthase (glutamine-hydrolysing)